MGFDNQKSYDIKVGGTSVFKIPVVLLLILQATDKSTDILLFNVQVNYMKSMKFGGAFVWALDLDDFNGDFCGQGKHPLLSHLRSLINDGKSHFCSF